MEKGREGKELITRLEDKIDLIEEVGSIGGKGVGMKVVVGDKEKIEEVGG